MSRILDYKGYQGTIESNGNGGLYGKVDYIRDLITYEARNLAALKKEFIISVDDYLAHCEEVGKTPDKPFK